MQPTLEQQCPAVFAPYISLPYARPSIEAAPVANHVPIGEAIYVVNGLLSSTITVTVLATVFVIASIICIVIGEIFHEWITITVGASLGIAAIFIFIHKRLMYGWINVQPEVTSFWKVEMWIKAVTLYVVQTVLLDVLMHVSQVFHWPWIVFDVIVLVAIAAMGHGYHHRPNPAATFSSGQTLCLLSLSAYMALICGKACTLLSRTTLSDAGFWSYSVFVLLLGISIPIYFILRWSQGRAMIPEAERNVVGEPSREWQSYADYMRLAINIADTIAILNLISPDQRRLHHYDNSMLVVTLVFMCVSHVASVLSFFGPAMFYFLTYSGNRITPFGSLLHHAPFVLVDGLLFSLRIVVWIHLEYELSAFILKNVFLFSLAAKASKSLHYHVQVYHTRAVVEDNLQHNFTEPTYPIPEPTFNPPFNPSTVERDASCCSL